MQAVATAPVDSKAVRRPERNFYIDLLKAIAIIGVITIHTSTGWTVYPVSSFEWISNMLWGTLSRASVPIFLMCSGALLLDPQKELTIKKLYSKNLLRIIVAMLFWAICYKAFHLIPERNFSFQSIVQALKEVLVFKQEFHLYYIHIIILVYVFLPITRIFVKNADKKQLQYFLAVWFILGIVYPTLKPYWPFSLLTGVPAQWMMNKVYASIGYGVLGFYIMKYPFNSRKLYLASLTAGFVFIFVGTWSMTVLTDSFYQGFLDGMTVGVALMATGIFGLCAIMQKKPMPKIASAVTYISKASFCIYLVHVFFMSVLRNIGLVIGLFPCVFSIPVTVAANLVCSLCVYAVLSRVPVVKKWLI